jgi:hypothetical protein
MVWCAACGMQLREPPKEKVAGKGGRKKLLAGLAIGLVVLLGGGGAAWYFLGGGDKPAPPKTGGPNKPTVPTGPSPAELARAESLRKEVRLAMRAGNWEEAETLRLKAVKLDPEHPDNLKLQGDIRVGAARRFYRAPRRLTTGSELPVIPECYRSAVAPGGQWVAMIARGGETLRVDTVLALPAAGSPPQWRRTLKLERPEASLWSVAFSKDGSALALGSDDGRLRLLRAEDGAELEAVPHVGTAVEVVFTSDGRRLVTLNQDGSTVVYMLNPLSPTEGSPKPEDARAAIALDPKNIWLLVGTKQELRVRYFGSRLPERAFKSDAEDLVALATSPDGATAAAGYASGKIVLFEPETGKRIGTGSLGGRLTQLFFERDGKFLLAWSGLGGTLSFVSVPDLDLVEQVETGLEPATRVALAPDAGALVAVGKGPRALTSRFLVYDLESAR